MMNIFRRLLAGGDVVWMWKSNGFCPLALSGGTWIWCTGRRLACSCRRWSRRRWSWRWETRWRSRQHQGWWWKQRCGCGSREEGPTPAGYVGGRQTAGQCRHYWWRHGPGPGLGVFSRRVYGLMTWNGEAQYLRWKWQSRCPSWFLKRPLGPQRGKHYRGRSWWIWFGQGQRRQIRNYWGAEQ